MRNVVLFLLILAIYSCRPEDRSGSGSLEDNMIVAKAQVQDGKVAYSVLRSDSSGVLSFSKENLSGSIDKLIISGQNDSLEEVLEFYSNGHLKAKYLTRNNELNGFSYYYYPSGNLEAVRNWKDDKKVGLANDYYDSSGSLKAVLLYNDEGELYYRKTFDEHGRVINVEGSKE